MWQEGDNILDELNRKIVFLKGKGILSYYIPTNPNKEKEPILDRKLQRKWLPLKSEAQKTQKQSKTRAENLIKLRPRERGKVRKNVRKTKK